MLTTIEAVHTVIYAVVVGAIFRVIFCGLTGTFDALLAVPTGLVGLEGVVFLGNGRRDPLTDLAQRFGDPKGNVGDIFLPEWMARRTFMIFTSLFVIGLVLVVGVPEQEAGRRKPQMRLMRRACPRHPWQE